MKNHMFFVYTWFGDDFEVIGAFSKKDEAQELAEANKTDKFTPIVLEQTIKDVIAAATAERLGALAPIVERIALRAADLAEIVTKERDRKPARRPRRSRPCSVWRSRQDARPIGA